MKNNNYEDLLSAAGKKLGITPDRLRGALEKGDIKALSGNLTKADKEKLRAVLADKELMKRLKNASSPEEVMRMLGKSSG